MEKGSSCVLPGNDAVKLHMTSSMGTLAFFINCLAFEIWSLMCQDLFCNPAKIYSDRSLYEDWESPSDQQYTKVKVERSSGEARRSVL
jgi:hypothetical protein